MQSGVCWSFCRVNKTRRLFFALWPNGGVRHQLDKIAAEYRPEKSRAIPAANLHATLIFLGPQPQELLTAITGAAARVQGRPFTLILQQLQVWRRPQVLCLCAEQIAEELIAMHRQLRQALLDTGVRMDDRAYRPHVTLARKVRRSTGVDRLPSPMYWSVHGFSLIESVSAESGVQYRELESWSFDG